MSADGCGGGSRRRGVRRIGERRARQLGWFLMPLAETLPVGDDTAQWELWSTTARLVVTAPRVLPRARRVVGGWTARVEAARSRFRPDSELMRLPDDGRPVRVSPLSAELVAAGPRAARRADGDVDPTLGAALVATGYDRTITLVGDGPVRSFVAAPSAWERVGLDGDVLTVPAGTRLDLSVTAKGWTADRCAREVAALCGGGVPRPVGEPGREGGHPRRVARRGAGDDARAEAVMSDALWYLGRGSGVVALLLLTLVVVLGIVTRSGRRLPWLSRFPRCTGGRATAERSG